MEFESDWSAAGLRARRRSEWQGLADFGFALLSLTWITLLLSASVRSAYGDLLCLLTPIWMISGIVWFSYLVFRNGGTFASKYPGMAGAVHGRVENGIIRIDGPAMCVVACLRDCPRCSLHAGRSSIQPPGFESSLPIVGDDIKRMWESADTTPTLSPATLLEVLQEDEASVTASGTLLGSDLRGETRWHVWLIAGITFVVIALAMAVWSIYRFTNLPPWVLNPPNHYQWNDADTASFAVPCVLALISLTALVAGIWNLLRTFRPIGKFAVLVTPTMVAIANKALALAYHGPATHHFSWSDRGIVVRDSSGAVLFLIPARWLDDEDRDRIAHWYAKKTSPPARSFYAGPKL